jgi:hypothetical protein
MSEELGNQDRPSTPEPGSGEPFDRWRAAALSGTVFALSSVPSLLAVVVAVAKDPKPERNLREYWPEAFVLAAIWAIWIAFGMAMGAVWGSNHGETGRAQRAEEKQARAEALEGKPGPFQAVPHRPFAARLSGFSGQHSDDSQRRESAAEPSQSTMPFYLAVTLGRPFRPKSAAYIRQILERIRRAWTDSGR